MFDGDPAVAAVAGLRRAGRSARRRRSASTGPTSTARSPKIAEETAELRGDRRRRSPTSSDDELGDLLFAVVNVARHLDIDAELALRAATDKFRARFEAVERLAADRGIDLRTSDLATLDALWNEAKNT